VVAHGWNVDWLVGCCCAWREYSLVFGLVFGLILGLVWGLGVGKRWCGGAGRARCWVLRERAPIRVVGVVALWAAAAVNRLVWVRVRVSFGSSGWGLVRGRRRVVVAGSVRSLRTA
jgi:hypothetical protein